MKNLHKVTNNEQTTVWALFGCALVLVVLAFLFGAESGEKSPAEMPDQAVELAQPKTISSIELTRLSQSGADALLGEEATLFDPTPMFLPTEWNSGQNALPANLIRVPGRSFENYPAKLIYREASLALSMPPDRDSPGRAIEVLAMLDLESPLMALGKTEGSLAKLDVRYAQVEIVSAKTGQQVLMTAVRGANVPGEIWQPLEFLLAVDAAGVVGAPAITMRSGSEEVDRFFKDYLAKTMRVGERLAPGAYRILVGP
jgi:hypothetical protein